MQSINLFAQILDKKNLPEVAADRGTFSRILTTVFVIIGALALLMIVLAGFKYVTSQGDSNKVTEAKNQILYSIIGLVLAALAAAIVHFVLGRF